MNPSRVAQAITHDQSASLEVGSDSAGETMFYWITNAMTDVEEGYWNQPIPPELTREEGEYVALIRGLREVRRLGYSRVIVVTNSPTTLNQLRRGGTFMEDLAPLHESAAEALNWFNEVTLIPYAVEMTHRP